MSTIYAIGDHVIYSGELPCGLRHLEHPGIVNAVEPDASGDQIVTVGFSCMGGPPIKQDIPASELQFVPGIEKFTVVSFDPPILMEEEGTGNPHIHILLSDSGGNKLLLAVHAELSFDLSAALAPTDSRRIVVGLYPDDAPKPT